MHQPIPILPGSNLHRTCIELYRRHHDLGDGSGRCAACGHHTPCPSSRHAALVIRTAGEDPDWYDGQLPASQPLDLPAPQRTEAWPPGHLPANRHASIATPGVTGYPVGGHGRRANVTYVAYER